MISMSVCRDDVAARDVHRNYYYILRSPKCPIHYVDVDGRKLPENSAIYFHIFSHKTQYCCNDVTTSLVLASYMRP